jgi:uncharacterized membrane protein
VVLSLSAVVLLGAFVLVLCRYAGLRTWHAVVCALFGFFLASTSAAPYISDNARDLGRLLSGLSQ